MMGPHCKPPRGPRLVKELFDVHDYSKMKNCELAKKAGFSVQALWTWRSGQRDMSLTSAIAFANVHGYELELVPKREESDP